MLALRTAPPSLRLAEAERIARDLYGLAASISALPGERDSNFRVRLADAPGVATPGLATREFVLKIQDVASDAGSNDCLVSVLDHLAEQDPTLPVPRPQRLIPNVVIARRDRRADRAIQYPPNVV